MVLIIARHCPKHLINIHSFTIHSNTFKECYYLHGEVKHEEAE